MHFPRGLMCQFDTALYITEKVSWCLYTLFVNDAGRIKKNCNCKVKLQTHNVAYNLNRNLWAVSALSALGTENVQIQQLQKAYIILSILIEIMRLVITGWNPYAYIRSTISSN